MVVSVLLWYKYWLTMSHTTCYGISPVTMVPWVHDGGNQDAVKMSSVKKCFSDVKAILWSVSVQITNAHLCLPNAATVNYTGSIWAARSMTLYGWRKASVLLCILVLGLNTICILIVVEHIFCECPVSKDFSNYIFTWGILCLKICDTCELPL